MNAEMVELIDPYNSHIEDSHTSLALFSIDRGSSCRL